MKPQFAVSLFGMSAMVCEMQRWINPRIRKETYALYLKGTPLTTIGFGDFIGKGTTGRFIST